eukprot:scaffold1595_cov257-Pavlova_lutheri.AAC.1
MAKRTMPPWLDVPRMVARRISGPSKSWRRNCRGAGGSTPSDPSTDRGRAGRDLESASKATANGKTDHATLVVCT